MNKTVYTSTTLQRMALFENVTHARLRDCVENDAGYIFIVEPNDIGKAIGTGGKHVHKLEQLLKKNVKIVEFSDNPVSFIKSLIYPLQATTITSIDGKLIITPKDSRTRGFLIGRNATILRSFEAVIQRYFPITEVVIT